MLLYTAYADDTPLFLKERIHFLIQFFLVSGLKLSTSKCEIAGIGTLKGVNLALCGKKYYNLMKETENTWCIFLL